MPELGSRSTCHAVAQRRRRHLSESAGDSHETFGKHGVINTHPDSEMLRHLEEAAGHHGSFKLVSQTLDELFCPTFAQTRKRSGSARSCDDQSRSSFSMKAPSAVRSRPTRSFALCRSNGSFLNATTLRSSPGCTGVALKTSLIFEFARQAQGSPGSSRNAGRSNRKLSSGCW